MVALRIILLVLCIPIYLVNAQFTFTINKEPDCKASFNKILITTQDITLAPALLDTKNSIVINGFVKNKATIRTKLSTKLQYKVFIIDTMPSFPTQFLVSNYIVFRAVASGSALTVNQKPIITGPLLIDKDRDYRDDPPPICPNTPTNLQKDTLSPKVDKVEIVLDEKAMPCFDIKDVLLKNMNPKILLTLDSLQAKFNIRLVIETDGSIGKVLVIDPKNLDVNGSRGFKSEITKVLEQKSKACVWKPGIKNGQAVRSYYAKTIGFFID
jgi:hypothetical protein